MDDLTDIAMAMVTPGKGILAADESDATIKKRFDAIALPSTEDNRRAYREMLFRTAPAMNDAISGVILYEETLFQKATDGTPLVKLIETASAIPGIKVDMGAKPLAGFPGETITEGLDGLRERLATYHAAGARFAKWRAVISIGEDKPSTACVKANAHALARYAALCQEARIVPIVEPEVLMDGPDAVHDIDTCADVTSWTLKLVFDALYEAEIDFEGMILKPNMITAGQQAGEQAEPEEVAAYTISCLRQTVPAAVPGITFLSGGQSDVDATRHLNLMNEMGPHPWSLTFSYGRALQAAAIAAWDGKPENVAAGQAAFNHRARMNSLASTGAWNKAAETAGG